MNRGAGFQFDRLRRHRVADQCVCCGSDHLNAAPAILMPFVAHRVFGWAPARIDESWGLHTVKQGMAYTVCRSLQCRDCGLLFSDIRFSGDELERLYGDYRGPEYTTLRESYEPGYTCRNDALGERLDYAGAHEEFLDPLLPAGGLEILDWGGDSGKNTPLQGRARRHDVYDISAVPVIAGARSVGREAALAHQYDLVVCCHVLEHVAYPSDLVQDMRQAMSPQSVLYVEVPFEEVIRLHGGEALSHKRHWHEHVNFFTPLSLEVLLSTLGFQVLSIATHVTVTAGLKSSSIIQVAARLA